MSLIQVEDLVSYQLRTSYLTEIADGVGERVITLNESFLNSAAFKAAGWKPNPALIKRTHSPPIPTAVAAEYFQAQPRHAGLTLEDDADDGSGFGMGGIEAAGGPAAIATKRRRRREQMEEDDSSDLSDESDDDTDQRAAQQIRFAKMPVRNRSGSSPIQASQLRQATTAPSPRAPPGIRRGSHSALETVKERARRDTATSSEMSSENEFDASGFHRQREAARAAASRAARLQAKISEEPTMGIKRQESDLLPEEEEDSDASDTSSAYIHSVDSVSILDTVETSLKASPPPPEEVVGAPPRHLGRTSTVRKSQAPPPPPSQFKALPPPRPMSVVRPAGAAQPRSLLSAALKAKKTKPSIPFENFASLSGKGDPNPIYVKVYPLFAKDPEKPFEVPIRRIIHRGEGGDRPVTVADLVGLSLWTYQEGRIEPALPADKLNVNWWDLRITEEDGELDEDFPPLDRSAPLTDFTIANNRGHRARSNSKTFAYFGLMQATQEGFDENQKQWPQENEQPASIDEANDEDITPRNTPQPNVSYLTAQGPRANPVVNTTYPKGIVPADAPQTPAAAPAAVSRGQQKFLRVHIQSPDIAPGQMVTLDVTTETYLADVLDQACRKRQLDKANHVLKLPGSGAVVLLDRTVSSIGNVCDLDLCRRRFATDGPLTMSASSPSRSTTKPSHLWGEPGGAAGSRAGASSASQLPARPGQGGQGTSSTTSSAAAGTMPWSTTHPLAREIVKHAELGSSATYKKYTVWRKQQLRFVGTYERILAIDGEYVHIVPSQNGKPIFEGGGKVTTVHFSNIIGCKVLRRHPTNFKLVVFRSSENKRYDFEAKSVDEAAEIVRELQRGISGHSG